MFGRRKQLIGNRGLSNFTFESQAHIVTAYGARTDTFHQTLVTVGDIACSAKGVLSGNLNKIAIYLK